MSAYSREQAQDFKHYEDQERETNANSFFTAWESPRSSSFEPSFPLVPCEPIPNELNCAQYQDFKHNEDQERETNANTFFTAWESPRSSSPQPSFPLVPCEPLPYELNCAQYQQQAAIAGPSGMLTPSIPTTAASISSATQQQYLQRCSFSYEFPHDEWHQPRQHATSGVSGYMSEQTETRGVATNHDEQCPYCGQFLKSSRYMKKHFYTCLQDSYFCREQNCGFTSKSPEELEIHGRYKHGRDVIVIEKGISRPAMDSRYKILCPYCGKYFSYKRIIQHMRIGDKKPIYKCDLHIPASIYFASAEAKKQHDLEIHRGHFGFNH